MSTVSLLVAAVALAVALVALFRKTSGPALPAQPAGNSQLLPLQLQAYERLVILCERISLPALISRTAAADLSAQEMRYVLVENIKQEFDYNTSQQIYVSAAAWDAVRNLRDQNMLVINQVSNVLAPGARASELNKQLLEVLMGQEGKALHSAALETLNDEAKRIMR